MLGRPAPHLDNDILISVLTPSWNRGHLLPRVFASLETQTDLGFEWVVADDGSTDDSQQVIANFARTAPFPISYLRADARIGKARMDNAAVAQASGTLVVWCDSDDYFLPSTIETLKAAWRTIPAQDRSLYVGITALAATDAGIIVDPLPGVTGCDISWNEMTENRKINADMVYMIRRDMLLKHPFPEVDLVIPESVVWSRIGDMKARYIAQPVKMVEYRAANAISFSGDMAYNRGRAHALAATGHNLRNYARPWKTKCWRLTTFIRYAIHGEIGLCRSRALWANNPGAQLFWLIAPFALMLALRDNLQGKVVRSHHEFDRNRDVVITAQLLNPTDR